MQISTNWLDRFKIGGHQAHTVGSVSNIKFDPDFQIDTEKSAFFTPSNFQTPTTLDKENWLGSKYLWADLDKCEVYESVVPPSIVVRSGHGYHVYYALNEPVTDIDELEYLNKVIGSQTTPRDTKCWNANRLLRIPGSSNTKEPPHVPVTIVEENNLVYTKQDIEAISRVDKSVRQLILKPTLDSGNWASRSELDFYVVDQLRAAGVSQDTIKAIFTHNPIGSKAQAHGNPEHYLNVTFNSAEQKTDRRTKGPQTKVTGLTETDHQYWHGKAPITNFTVIAKQLFATPTDTTFVVDIVGSDFLYPDVTIKKTDFSSSGKLEKLLARCPQAVWTGTDASSKQLLAHLMDKYQLTAVEAIDFTGWKNGHWVSDGEVITPTGLAIRPEESPIKFVRRQTTPPVVNLNVEPEPDWDLYYKLNTRPVMQLLTGWFTAALLKPRFEESLIRFPILQVFGTKGSGKTSLIERGLLPVFGQNPTGLDATTTAFVLRSALAATNAVPVYFTEFRVAHGMDRFVRLMLMAYDTGKDARGTAEQSVIEYSLSAPFLVTGEDMIPDHAARERIIPVRLDPRTIANDSIHAKAFDAFHASSITGTLIRYFAKLKNEELHTIHQQTYVQLPMMPNRIRSNMSVVHTGNVLFSRCFNMPVPTDLDYLKDSYNIIVKGSRTTVLADDFVTSIANSLPNPVFKWEADGSKLWFQLAPAHSWWLRRAKQEGRSTMELDGILYQMQELGYYLGKREGKTGESLIGVDLVKARSEGLDVPTTIKEAFRTL